MKGFFKNLIIIVLVFNFIVFHNIQNIYAFNIVQDTDTNISIPLGYHFAPRYIENKTVVSLCDAPKEYQWIAVTGEDYYQLRKISGSIVMPPDSYKGKLWAKYSNVGFYNGYWLDMKITIIDWNSACRRVEFGRTRIGVGNATSASGGTDRWMSVRIDYYYAGTETLFSGLKGHQPVGDMDYWKSTKQCEWLKIGNNCSSKIIIPSKDYSKFDLSKIANNMIGVNSTGGGGTKNDDGVGFVYLFESPSHTITWYGGFLGMNMTCPIQEYQINYMANGGNGSMNSMVVNYNTSIKLTSNSLTKKGHYLNGWHVYREFDDTWYVNGSWNNKPSQDTSYTHIDDKGEVYKIAGCGNVYLYACWEPNSHRISYDANGGSEVPSEQVKVYGNDLRISSKIPIREGYSFKYWTTTSYDIGGRNSVIQYFNNSYIKRAWINILDSKTIEILVQADNATIVEVPTWTSNAGQDDLIWHSLSKGTWNRAGESFNFGTQISIDSHKGEVGEYLHHIYAYNSSHQILGSVGLQSRGFKYYPGDIYAGYHNGGTQVLYAQWEEINQPPEIYARTNYYFKDSIVGIGEVIKNANAFDKKDGDISDKILILEIEYPDGTVVSDPDILDTHLLGMAKVTYKVSNSLSESNEIQEVVYIVEEGINNSVYSDLKVYSRFISKDELDDGVNALNTLSIRSIWLSDSYHLLLKESLSNNHYLEEFDYVNEEDYIQSLKGNR